VARGALFLSGGEYPVVGDISGHQNNPNIALNQEGGFVVWQNATDDSGGERIVAQRISPDQMGMGSVVIISQNISGQNEVDPKVALLNEGGAVVVWQAGPRNGQDVYVRFLDDQGLFLSSIIRVNSHDQGVQGSPSVAVSENGLVLVVWSSEGVDGSGMAICGQFFDPIGTKVGSEFRINQVTASNQSLPVVSGAGANRFIVGWLGESVNGKNSSGAPNLKCNLMARFVTGSGPSGNEYRLSEGEVIATEAQIAGLGQEGFIAVWTQKDETSTRNVSEIHARKFGSDGLPKSSAVRVNTYLPGAQNKPVLAAADDEVMVSWVSSGQDAGGLGVRARLLSGGAEFGVNSQGNLDQSMPTLSGNGAGTILAVWVNTIKADHSILSAQRFSLGAENQSVPEVVDITSGVVELVGEDPVQRQTNPSAVADRNARSTTVNEVVGVTSIVIDPTEKPTDPSTQRRVVVPETTVSLVTDNSTGQIGSDSKSGESRSNSNRSVNTQTSGITTVPDVSTAAQMALNNFAQSRGGSSARQHLGNSRTYLSPVRQQVASTVTGVNRQIGSAPSRSSIMLGSTFSRARSSSLRISSLRDVRLGSQSSRSTIGRNSSAEGELSASSTTGVTARERVSGIRSESMSNTSVVNSRGGRPVPAGVTRTGQATTLRWVSKYGGRYQVQKSNDKVSWENVGTVRRNTNGVDSVDITGSNSKYYRVVRVN
tara:strand:+ start:1091 stop:3223 length:2133 start_codon:yes stop_codon:yes gene_type:complete